MTEIQKVLLDEAVEKALIALSNRWENEEITYGYATNSAQSLQNEDIFLALSDNQPVGYLLCHTYFQENHTAAVPQGKRCLEIEEVYVLPEYRSQGLGQALFRTATDNYGDAIDYITLSTATKNYKSILHFYIEELGMTFWSARLFKKLEK